MMSTKNATKNNSIFSVNLKKPHTKTNTINAHKNIAHKGTDTENNPISTTHD
jgi:hypothetical protein